MKKFICCILLAALLVVCASSAYAQVPSLSGSLFQYAKSALTNLASGDYQKVVTSLPFSDVSPSADEWRNLAEGSFSSLSGSSPQTRYAVAYWIGNVWKVAVPVSEPSSGGVETLVLVSEDGKTFTGYGCSSWKKVTGEFQSSDYVSWNEEYNASTSVVVENDLD